MKINKNTNAKRIAYSLERHGVEYIFGQSNPASVTLACLDIGIRQISYRQENAGTYMAQGYASNSNKVPVVTAQHGPAATLLVPGLAESYKASIPIIALVEEIPKENEEKNAFQEIDHSELFKGVSKWVKKIPSSERIEDIVDMAFTVAASGRPGPVVLLCPKDIIDDKNEYEVNERRTVSSGHYPLDRSTPEDRKIEEAIQQLAKAKKPFIYAGGGVISSEAQNELQSIQEECHIPVATTTMGKGSVDENHPLSIGPIGYYMGKRGVSRYIKQYIEEADVILLVGNRTNQNGTDSWTLLPETASFIHLDIDPVEIGRNYESLRLVGDVKVTLKKLKNKLLENRDGLDKLLKQRKEIENFIKKSREEHKRFIVENEKEKNNVIKVEDFLSWVDQKLEADHVIVSDASFSSVWNVNYITAKDQRKFVFPRGLAGLGWGLPLAMGAKIAKPNQKVFCLVGDGGFSHVWSELETCKRHDIDIVVVVINNARLGYQVYSETSQYGRYTDACDFSYIDHTKVAEASGINSVQVKNPKSIPDILDKVFKEKGSTLIDLITDPEEYPPVTIFDKLENE